MGIRRVISEAPPLGRPSDEPVDVDFVVGLQEVPRVDAGWKTETQEGWCILQRRSDAAWRGTAVMFKRDKWAVMRKRAGESGSDFDMSVQGSKSGWVVFALLRDARNYMPGRQTRRYNLFLQLHCR